MTKTNWQFLSLILLFLGFAFNPNKLHSQVQVNLLTNCYSDNIKIPIQIKNFENISALELELSYNSLVLRFNKSLIHNQNFSLKNDPRYVIQVNDELGNIRISWSAYYGVSILNDVLLFLDFEVIADGNSNFSWNESNSHIDQIGNIGQAVNYSVEGNINFPVVSPYQLSIEQLTMGCRDDSENGCKAQAKVELLGGTSPLTYQWNDQFNQKTQIAIGLCQDPVSVIVKDASGCFFGGEFQAEVYPANKMEISAYPEVAYITKPEVEFTSTFSYAEPQVYKWDFGDEAFATSANTTHSFQEVGAFDISLWTRSDEGCDTTVYIRNFEVRELDFCIPNVFTPNGDNVNDEWIFKIGDPPTVEEEALKTGYFETKNCSGDDLIFSEHFKHTRLVVINRNGSRVFECTDCLEPWDGGNLPDGVYFYVFEWEGEYSSGKEQGDVTILRGN